MSAFVGVRSLTDGSHGGHGLEEAIVLKAKGPILDTGVTSFPFEDFSVCPV